MKNSPFRFSRLISQLVCLLAVAFVAITAAPREIVLPVGTEIAVTTIDRINSKKADTYREYAASLDDPIVIDGVTVVPAKTDAVLRLTVKHTESRDTLSLSLIAVKVDGQRVDVNTDKVDSQSGSKNKRTAIGAAAGGGAGAGIGAAAGGAAGAAVGGAIGAVTGGILGHRTAKGVEIAPETRFSFKLTEEAVIQSQAPAAAAPEARRSTPPPPVPVTVSTSATAPTPPPPPPSPTPPPPPPPAPPKTASAIHGNGGTEQEVGAVYFQDEAGMLIPLERTKGTAHKENGREYSEMDGAASPVRLKRGQKMQFVVRLANEVNPSAFTLSLLDASKSSRRTRSESKGRMAPVRLDLFISNVGEASYSLVPVTDLAAGEYAFSLGISNDVYCFGVDASR